MISKAVLGENKEEKIINELKTSYSAINKSKFFEELIEDLNQLKFIANLFNKIKSSIEFKE